MYTGMEKKVNVAWTILSHADEHTCKPTKFPGAAQESNGYFRAVVP